ncbi:MAG TPA: DNA polymerase I [Candidatus Saccharimonadales bacterium]|nr:DNA polymerase I [Candidatus Saccharimonadales bacterium]
MADTKKFAIIDGKSVFYRGYYAMPNLSTGDGTPTGGVYGFAVMALEVIKRLNPDYVCVAWDKPKTNIRKRLKLYPAYKAGRKPAPPDFYDQIPLLHDLLDAFGWPLYELDDYEADDIMGTLAVQARKAGLDTLLVTSDLDLLQVINGNVHVYALKKGLSNIELFHPESFEGKYGIKVDQFLDLKALKGDSSDNIPGAPGIGEKTAVELLRQFKTLDGIYDNLDLIKESTRNKLEAGKDSVYLSKKLAAIWMDAPIKLNLKDVDGSKCDPAKVQEILQRLEFRTLARQLPEYMHVPEDAQLKKSKQIALPDANHISSKQELAELNLPKTDELVIYGLSEKPHGINPLSLTISADEKQSVTLNLAALDADAVRDKLKDYIEKSQLIGHNLKATLQILRTFGINPQKIKHDTLIGAFLINPLRREQSLSELAETELDVHLQGIDGANSEEIAVIRKLYEHQNEDLKELKKIAELARDIEWPIIPVLADMEYLGIKLDVEHLHKVAEQLQDTISDIEQQIYGHADRQFNIASPIQLSDVLFNKLMLPTGGIKKGKAAYSTAANELDKLRGIHPIIDLITQYREVTKLMNTYVIPLPNMVDKNNRLHTTFSLTTAQTGRLSSSEPNLQNIPVRTELGRKIRAAFVADPGNLFISADYSQFELRMAALLADDKELIDMFNRDVDVHTATASQIYEREPEDITKNMRRDAKVVNFGILYGMSPHGLSVATGMTQGVAKKFIDKYFELRKPILEYMNKSKEQARSQGYVETLFGRRRPTPDVKSSNFAVRSAAERAAINMPLQGTCADIMKLAMIKVQQKLKNHKDAYMLLQIHDSILVECPEKQADELARELKEIMENAYKLDVKLTVDTAVGKDWGEL